MIVQERVEFNKKHIDMMLQRNKRCGIPCNLDNPQTIQEKLMWLNIYDADPLKTECADKLLVKKYAERVIGKDISVKNLIVWNSVDEIDFDKLPDKFVLKCNHGSGMNIIVKDKSKMNIPDVNKKLDWWMHDDFSMRNGFESHYHWIERKIFAEELIGFNVTDYKFLCFNGEPKYLQIISDRNNTNRRLNYYDMDLNKCVGLSRTDFPANYNIDDATPKFFDVMVEYAKKLSEPFKFVRVDFYETYESVLLGELTFTPGAFSFRYTNAEDNYKMGDLLKI